MMRLWSFVCTTVGSFLFGGLILLFILPPLRPIPAQILVRDDGPPPEQDALVLLMGDPANRAPHAAELLKRGYAKKIVFVEVETDEMMRADLKSSEGKLLYKYLTQVLGVSSKDIIFADSTAVTSTEEEARELYKLLERHKLKDNILVTSWYHSSRAAWIFEKTRLEHSPSMNALKSYPSPLPPKWYAKERDFLNVYLEYLKWVYYYVKYDLLA